MSISLHKRLFLLILGSNIATTTNAQITMSTGNCTVSANEIQMDVFVTNNSTEALRWNGALLRFTVPAAILPSPATSGTYAFVYLGGSDFPASFPAGAGKRAGGGAFRPKSRLLTWTSTPSFAYKNITCDAPLISPRQTKKIGRFSFKITNGQFKKGRNATLAWSKTSSCNLYRACEKIVKGYSATSLRTLASPCVITVPK